MKFTKSTKLFKKFYKGKLNKLNCKSHKLVFGNIGLKAASSGLICPWQVEAARQAIKRKIKKEGRIWIRLPNSLFLTSKPAGSRMGKGKGNLFHWSYRVKSGSILFEISTRNSEILGALRTGGAKLPIKNTNCFH